MIAIRTSAGLIVLLLASGCGLSEYEAQMRKAQDRVLRFDEENRLLGEPLVIPTVTDAKTKAQTAIANVFLRPPRGIAEKVGQARLAGLYRYPAAQQGGAFTGLELAFGKGDEDLAGKYATTWFPGLNVPALQKRQVAPLTFQFAEFDYNDTLSVAVYITPAQKGSTQVAIIYWLDRGKKSMAGQALNFSLLSLGVDTEVSLRRGAYASRSPWAPSR